MLESELETSLKKSLQIKDDKLASLEARLQESSSLNQQLRQELKSVRNKVKLPRPVSFSGSTWTTVFHHTGEAELWSPATEAGGREDNIKFHTSKRNWQGHEWMATWKSGSYQRTAEAKRSPHWSREKCKWHCVWERDWVNETRSKKCFECSVKIEKCLNK